MSTVKINYLQKTFYIIIVFWDSLSFRDSKLLMDKLIYYLGFFFKIMQEEEKLVRERHAKIGAIS